MALTSIGDLARSLILQQGNQSARAGVNRLTQELASGRRTDVAAGMQGNMTPLAATENTLTRIAAWTSAGEALRLRLASQQTALGALDGISVAQSQALLRASGTNQAQLVDLAALDARDHLDAALGLLNAHVAGQSVFSGTRSDQPAVGSVDDLLDAVWPIVAAAPSPEAAVTAIRTWFDDPAGFAAQIYRGGGPSAAIGVGPETAIAADVTALDPAIRTALAGLTAGAVLERGLFPTSAESRQQMALLAGEVLAGNAQDRASLAARIGLDEYRLAQSEIRNTAERTALGISRSAMITADPFETATQLEQVETRLSLIHVLTGRLQDLSLVKVLR